MKKGKLKRFGVYTLLYVLVTILATVSTLAIEAISPKTSTDSGSAITPVVTETVGEKLINNVLCLNSANVNLSMDLYENSEAQQTYSVGAISGVLPKVKLNFSGCINIADLSNVGVNGTLRAMISGSEITMHIAYVNGSLYLSNDSMDIKIETASFSKIMDILPLFGLNLGSGMDFSGIDTNQILASFQEMEAVEQDDGTFKMTLNLMEGISLDLITDSEYNIKSVTANELAFGNMTANLSAGVEKTETVQEITPPKEETEYVDVTKTLNIMDCVQEILQNKKMHLDINANYVGDMNFGVSGVLDVDYSENINAFADLNLNINGENHDVSLGVLGDDLLVNFAGMKFMADKTDLMTAGKWLAQKFGVNSGANVSAGPLGAIVQMLPFDVTKLLNGDLSDININQLLQFTQGEENEIILTINGSAIGIDKSVQVKIELDENDQFKALGINDLDIAGSVVNVRVAYSKDVILPTIDDSEYFVINNISSFLPAVYETVGEILENKTVSLNIATDINIKDIAVGITGAVTLNFADTDNLKAYANLGVTAMNKTFAVRVAFIKDTVYVSIDSLNFKAKITELKDLITAITTALGGDGDEIGDTADATATELTDLITELKSMQLSEILSGLINSIATDSTHFAITLNGEKIGLNKDITLTLGYGTKANEFSLSDLDYNGITASLTATLTDKSFTMDVTQTNYTSLSNADDLVIALLNTVDEIKTSKAGTLEINANVVFNGQKIAVSGAVAYENGLIYANLTAQLGKTALPITAYYSNDTIYANISGVKVQLTTQDILALVQNLNDGQKMAIALPFNIDEIKAGDLSSLSLNIVKAITIGENSLNLILSKTLLNTTQDINLTIAYNGGAVTGLSVADFGMSGITAEFSANLSTTADIPTLVKTDYLAVTNLQNLVPAIMNTAKEITTSKTVSLNVNTDINIKDTAVGVKGAITLNFADIDNLKAYANLGVTAMNKTFAVRVAFIKDTVYVSIDNLNFKAKITELKDLITAITTALGGDSDEIGDTADATATELTDLITELKSMQLSEILSGLINSIATDSTHFAITLNGEKIGLNKDITLTLGYGTKANEFSLNGLDYNGITASLTATLTDKSFTMDVTQTTYTSLTNADDLVIALLNAVDEIKTSKAGTLEINANVVFNGQKIAVSGAVAYDNGLIYADLTAQLGKTALPITAYYSNDTIYANVSGVKVQLTTQDILALVQNLNDGQKMAITLPFNIDEIKAGDLSSLSLNIIKAITIGENSLNLTLSKTLLNTAQDITITLAYNGGAVTGLNVADFGMSGITAEFSANLSTTANIPELVKADYLAVTNLQNLVPAIMNTAKEITTSKTVSLNIATDINIKDTAVSVKGAVTLNFADMDNLKAYANLGVTAMNKTFAVRVAFIKDTVYVSIDNLNFKAKITELKDLITAITTALGGDSDEIGDTADATATELTDLITELKSMQLSEILSGLINSIATDSTHFAITLNGEKIGLNKDITLTLGYGTKANEFSISDLDYNGITADLTATLTDKSFTMDVSQTNYTSLANSSKLVSAMNGTIGKVATEKKASLNISAPLQIDGTNLGISGVIAYDNGTIYTQITADVDGTKIPLTAQLVGDTIYAEICGLKVSLEIGDIVSLLNEMLGTSLTIGTTENESQSSALLSNTTQNSTEKTNSITQMLGLSDFNLSDLSKLNLNIIKSLDIGENASTVTLSRDLFGTDNDITIKISYKNGEITGLNVTGFAMTSGSEKSTVKFSVGDISSSIIAEIEIPSILPSDYAKIGDIKTFVPAVIDSVKSVLTSQKLALNIGASVTKDGKTYGVSGLVYANWAKLGDEFDLAGLDIFADLKINFASKEIPLTARLIESELYLTCENLKIRTTINNISDLVDEICELLPQESKTKSSKFSEILKGTRIEKILNGDYSAINSEMIKSLTLDATDLKITLNKDVINAGSDFTLSLNYGTKVNGIVVKDFALKGYTVTELGFGLDYDFTPNEIVADDYEDVTGLDKVLRAGLDTAKKILTDKTVAVKIDNIEGVIDGQKINVVGEAYVDFSTALEKENGEWIFDYKKLKGYANLAIMVENGDNHYIVGHMDGERIYLVYNNLKLSLAIEKIDSLIDVVNQMKFITESLKTADLDNVKIQNLIDDAKAQTGSVPKPEAEKVDIAEILATFFPKLDFNAILNGDISSVDFGWLKHLTATENDFALTVDKDFYGLNGDVNIAVGYGDLVETANISNVKITDVIFNKINVYLCDNLVIPSITKSDYSSLDSTEQFMNSMLKTAVEVVDNKHISFSLNTQLVHENTEVDSNKNPTKTTLTHVTVKDGSSARFDWSNAYEKDGTNNKFNIKKMNAYINFDVTTVSEVYYYTNGVRNSSASKSATRTHSIEVTYLNNMIYIKYNNMAAKISGDSIKQIVQSICGILGIESDSEDLFDNISALIGSTSGGEFNVSNIIDKIGTELIKSFTLTDTQLNGVFDLSGFGLGIDSLNSLNLSVTYGTSGMGNLTLRNLYVANSDVSSVNIGLKNFVPITSAPQGNYMDLSNIGQMLTAVQNTLAFKDFELSGNVRLYIKLNSTKLLDWSVPLNAKIKLTDDGFEANIRLGEIPVVVGVNNDVPYEAGDWDGGKNRYLNIYIKNNMVYLYRTETVTTALVWRDDRSYEKKLAVHLETLMSNPLEYLLDFGLGLSDSIMSEIYKSVNKERTNPLDYSNILKGFSTSGSTNTMTLNLKELAENDMLDTMSLGLRNTTHNGKTILGGVIFYMHMPLTSAINIDLESNELTHVNVGQTINMSNVDNYARSYSYQEGAVWDASNGDWRKVSQEQYSLTFVTGTNQSFGAVSGVTGASCTLPTPSNFTTDDGKSRCEYTFAGWFTTKNCEDGTQYTQNVIPRKNTTLYAKWDIKTTPYYSVMFDTNCEQTIANKSILSGNTCTLPNSPSDYVIDDKTTERKEYFFAGWFTTPNFADGTEVTGEFTVTSNIRLYAKWNVVTTPYYKINYVCDDSESLTAVYVLAGDTLVLPTYPDKKEIKTDDQVISYTFVGWYTTPNFADGTKVADEIMVSENLTLYENWYEEVRNRVMVEFVTNNDEIYEPSISGLEGSVFSLPDYTGTIMTIDSTTANADIQYEFAGWYIDEEWTTKFESSNIPYGGATLYAKWDEIRRTHYARVYDGSELLWTSARLYENESVAVALGLNAKLNDTTLFYTDTSFANIVSDWTMPNSDLNIYARNKYTVSIKGNIATKFADQTFELYQANYLSGVTNRANYNTDDGTQTCRKEYTFAGYYIGENKIDISKFVAPNYNVEIVAKWSKYDRPYITISFNVDWAKPGAWIDKGSDFKGNVVCKTRAQAPNSIRVLSGINFTVDPKNYNSYCVYRYTVAWCGVDYTFRVKSWKTGGVEQLFYRDLGHTGNGDYNVNTTFNFTSNTTLYAVWYKD